MARILSYGESTLVALLQIKVLDPVRAFCRSFRLNSPRKGRGAGAGGPLLPFPMSPARTRASAMRTYHHCKPRLLRPFALFKPEQLLIIALREALSQNRGQPVDQPHAAERLSSIPSESPSQRLGIIPRNELRLAEPPRRLPDPGLAPGHGRPLLPGRGREIAVPRR